MNRLLKGCLLASLCFNVMFAVGYFCAPTGAEPPESPEAAAAAVADKFGLDEAQRAAFADLRREAHDKAAELARYATLLQHQLWSEAADPAADPKAIEATAEDLAAVRDAYRQVQLGQFRRFLDCLDAPQRQAIVQRFRRWQERRGAAILEKLDSDKDGRLSPPERLKGLRNIRERIEQFRDRVHDAPGPQMRPRRFLGPRPFEGSHPPDKKETAK